MTALPVAMFGRQEELDQIEQVIRGETLLAFICVHGPGGIGKTTLLKAIINNLYGHQNIICTNVLDFDDLRLRVAQHIPYVLAEQLDKAVHDHPFDSYFRAYAHLQEMQEAGQFSAYQVQEQAQEAEKVFLEDYARLTREKRIVILVDTVEKVQHTAVWRRATLLFQKLTNTVIVLAGRENAQIYEELQAQLRSPAVAHLQELEELSFDDALAYFNRTPLGESIARNTPEVSRSVCELTRRPILIDLAVDWLREGKPLPELEQPWSSLDEEAKRQLRLKFERSLVQIVLNLAEPIHEVILLMAHVYHFFDAEILAFLTESNENECRRLLTRVGRFSFIRPRSSGGVVLHDEMQRLIVTHVWPLVDLTRNRRCELSAKMIDYFDTQLTAHQDEPVVWQAIAAEQLYHQLYVNVDQGYERFKQLFQQADIRHRTDFCLMLLEFLRPFEKDLSAEQKAWLDIRRGWVAIKLSEPETALGLIDQGLAQLHRLEVQEDVGQVYNSLGYCHRLLGNWDQAIVNYEEALHWSKAGQNAVQIAETMNNIANVCRLSGDFDRALRYTKVGLNIREKLDSKLAIANSNYVRGMVLWEIGNSFEAATCLENARKLYVELGDEVRVAWVDKFTGFFHYRIGDVDIAAQHLERAIAVFREHNVKGDLAETLNMLSRVTRRGAIAGRAEEAAFRQAEQHAVEGLGIAQEIGDRYKIAECNLTLCLLYYRWGNENQLNSCYDEAKGYYEKVQSHYDKGYPIAHSSNYIDLLSVYHMGLGNTLYNLGLLASQNEEEASAVREWDDAIAHYLWECHISATYKEIRFDRALAELASRLMRLPTPALTHKYCNSLIAEWRTRRLDHQFPQLIDECEQVKAFIGAPEEAVIRQLATAQADLMAVGDWKGVLETGQNLLEYSRAYLRGPEIVRALNTSAFALRQLGRFFQARRLCTQSLHIGEAIEHPESIAESHFVLGAIHWIVGNTAEAATHLRQARETYEGTLSDPIGTARVNRYEGFLYFRIRNFEKALQLLNKASVCFDKHHEFADLADALVVQARVLSEFGQYEEARHLAERAKAIACKIGNNYVHAEALINLYLLNQRDARQAQESGELQKAAHYAALAIKCHQEGSHISCRFGYDLLISVYEKLAGDIAFDDAKIGHAFEHYVAALEHGAKFEYARLHRTLDPSIDRLTQLSPDLIRQYADYVIREWKIRKMDTEFPDVVNMFELVKEYRDYV